MADTMKAFGLADEGSGAGFLEVPVPEADPGEVRVRVRASSVNGFDAFVASGMARGSMEHRYPVVVGKDYAGTIEAVGEGVERFGVGDEVAGILPPVMYVASGSYAEYVAVPAEGFIEPKPANHSFEQAASVGLAAVTALACVDHVSPSEGATVLIIGATGGVGSYAVQFASARGATVIASALPQDEPWIRELGADESANYSSDVPGAVRERHPDGIDGLIVAVHVGDSFAELAELVRDGGKVASTVGGADAEAIAVRGVGAENVLGQSDPARFGTVLGWAAEGTLTVPITKTYAFDEVPEALGLVGKRSSRGKLAITIP